MKSSIWMRCKSWLNCVMCGELRLTADVLWLAEIDGEAPPREPLLPGIGAPGTVAGLTRVSTAQPDCPRSRPLRRSVPMRCNLSSVISPTDRVKWRFGPWGTWTKPGTVLRKTSHTCIPPLRLVAGYAEGRSAMLRKLSVPFTVVMAALILAPPVIATNARWCSGRSDYYKLRGRPPERLDTRRGPRRANPASVVASPWPHFMCL